MEALSEFILTFEHRITGYQKLPNPSKSISFLLLRTAQSCLSLENFLTFAGKVSETPSHPRNLRIGAQVKVKFSANLCLTLKSKYLDLVLPPHTPYHSIWISDIVPYPVKAEVQNGPLGSLHQTSLLYN